MDKIPESLFDSAQDACKPGIRSILLDTEGGAMLGAKIGIAAGAATGAFVLPALGPVAGLGLGALAGLATGAAAGAAYGVKEVIDGKPNPQCVEAYVQKANADSISPLPTPPNGKTWQHDR